MQVEHGADLVELDAEAANLDLLVGPAAEVEEILRQPARPDRPSGTPLAAPVGVGEETFRGQVGPAEVARGEAIARDVELSRPVLGHRPEVRVEHVGQDVRRGSADGDGAAVVTPRGVAMEDAAHRCLGRPVFVDDLDRTAEAVVNAPGKRGRQGLAADDQTAEAAAAEVACRGTARGGWGSA